VVVINETMARRFWPNEDPIGKQIHLQIDRGIAEDRPREVVGIVGNVRHWLSNEPMPVMYTSYLQHALEYPGGRANSHLRKTLVIRTKSDPSVLTADVRRAVAEVDVDQPAYDILAVEQLLSATLSPSRFYVRLLGLFGGIALILAAIGTYGVMSYSVCQRRHEIGIRMALGANRAGVVWLVLMHGLKLTAAGVAAGIAGALALTRFIASALYGVTPTDPPTLVVVSLLLSAVALLASYLPARRAMQVDPVTALRSQ
jgi:putative ABC transport system permease protein